MNFNKFSIFYADKDNNKRKACRFEKIQENLVTFARRVVNILIQRS